MLPERIEKLKQEYTDEYVVVDGQRPELARFKDMVGQVKTVNCSGRALVEFEADNDRGWHDIELDYLKVVDKPEPAPAKANVAAAKARAAKEPAQAKEQTKQKLSPLEVARMQKEAAEAAGKSQPDRGPAAGPAGGPEKPAAGPPEPGPQQRSERPEPP